MKIVTIALTIASVAFASDLTRGNYLDATIRDTAPLFEDAAVCARVSEIGQKVAAASGNPGFQFRFYVLNSADVTTFSSPGGAVYVTTGLLRHLRSDDELAAVLGHEVAHINKRHLMNTEHSERSKIFWGRVLVVGVLAAGIFASAAVEVATSKAFTQTTAIVPTGHVQTNTNTIRGPDHLISAQTTSMPQYQFYTTNTISPQLGNLAELVVDWGTTRGGETLLNLYYKGYKDEYEFEADRLGMEYAAKSGYNRAAMVQFLDRLTGPSGEMSPGEMTPLHATNKTLAERTAKAKTAGAGGPQ